MSNAFVRGGRRGLGYAKFLSCLWGCLRVQGFRVNDKKNYGFCGGRTRFFIYRVGGGGS
jgi:hypothetical protein